MSADDLNTWQRYYSQKAEALRFAGDLAGGEPWQAAVRIHWERVVLPAASSQATYTGMLNYIDDWLLNGDDAFDWGEIKAQRPGFQTYLTQANMALDAATPDAPPAGNDPYARWRAAKALIAINEGARWFRSRVFSDPQTYIAFSELLADLNLAALDPFGGAGGGGDSAPGPIGPDPNEEKGFVQDLDIPGMKAVSDWFTTLRGYPDGDSARHFVCDLVQVMRAVRELRDEPLAFWVGNYKDVSLVLGGYKKGDATLGPARQSSSLVGPAISIAQDGDRLRIAIDDHEVAGFTYAPKGGFPTASWSAGGVNAFGAELSFGAIVDPYDDKGYLGSQIAGQFLVPSSYGGDFYGVSLDWTGGADTALIAVVARTDEPPSILPPDPWWKVALSWGERGLAIVGDIFLIYMIYKEVRGAMRRGDTAGAARLKDRADSFRKSVEDAPKPPKKHEVPEPPQIRDVDHTGEQWNALKDASRDEGRNDEKREDEEKAREEAVLP
jgi:hypothetical protein